MRELAARTTGALRRSEARFRELELRKDPACPICGTNPSIHELIDYEAFCGIGAEPA